MSDMVNKNQSQQHNEEITPKSSNGIVVLLLNIILIIAGIVALAYGIYITDSGYGYGILLIIIGVVYSFIIGPILFGGLKILKPNEALVLTLFGRYYGTLRGEGFFFVNPFVSAINPTAKSTTSGKIGIEQTKVSGVEVTMP